MKRVLVLCYSFPPFNHVSSLRGLKAARAFQRRGWEVTVLRSAFTGARQDLGADTDGLRVETYAPTALSRALARTDGHRLARLARSAVRRLIVPDHGWLLLRPVERAIARLGGLGAFDAVVSISYPFVLHEVCRRAKRAGQDFFWIADNRDMWADSPYRGRSLTPRAWLRRIERSCLRACDQATFASETTAALYGNAYGLSAEVVLNGWDGEVFKPAAWTSPAGTLTLAHTGSLYGGRRSLKPLLDALARLQASEAMRSTVLLAGADSQQAGSRLGPAPGIEVRAVGQLPRDEAYKVQAGADILILAMEDSAFDASFTPAKLFEYAFTGKPIVALARPHSDVGRLIEHHRLGIASFSADAIAAFLQTILYRGWSGPVRLEALTADHQFATMVRLADGAAGSA